MGSQPQLRRDRRGNRVAGTREGEEERVALRIHLDAIAPAELLAEDPAVLRDDLGVAVAEPLEEVRRAFDVREDEGDGSCGTVPWASLWPMSVGRGCGENREVSPARQKKKGARGIEMRGTT